MSARAKACTSSAKPASTTTAPIQRPQWRTGTATILSVAAYTAKNDSAFEVVGEQIGAGPYGIAVPKDQSQLRDAIKAAVQALIDDGEYKAILDKWQVAQGALTTATVNAGT